MNRRAYTLLELMLVLALVVILAALVYPSFDAMYGQYKLSAAADSAKAGMTNARAQAIEEGQPYRFAIVPGKGNFRVAPHSQAYWTGGDPPVADGGHPLYAHEDSLPQGIVFVDSDQAVASEDSQTALDEGAVPPTQWKTVAVFLPDGTARAADDNGQAQGQGQNEIVQTFLRDVRAPRGTPVTVTLRCMTGTVSTRRTPSQGGW